MAQLVTAAQGTQVTHFWLCTARPDSLWIPFRLLHPQIPPQNHCRVGGDPSAPTKNSFLWDVWNEGNQVCDGHNTLKCWNNYEVGEKVFFSQKFGFPLFLLVCSIMPNFPLQGAVQRLHFLQRADSKSSFIQEKNETKPGDTWTNAETCWSCLWKQEGLGESWQLFLTIFPSKQQMKGNCQSWTGGVLLIQHFQRGQEISRVCNWNGRQPQFSTGGEEDPSLV